MEFIAGVIAYINLHKDWFQSIFSGIGVVLGVAIIGIFYKKKKGGGAGRLSQRQRSGDNSINIQIGNNGRREKGE